VKGLDACLIGPRDLSNNMGFPDGPNHPEVQSVIDNAIRIMNNVGLIAGITAGTHTDAEAQIQRGATMILAAAQSLVLAGSKSFLPEHS
jgi:4-hydroxy-2-oxoheptanedioate aldolase